MSDKSRCPMCFSNDDHTPQCLNRNYETDLRARIAADIEHRKRELTEGYADMAKAIREADRQARKEQT